jgi:hypothetical protein
MSEVASTETIHRDVGAVSPELPAQVAEDYERFKPCGSASLDSPIPAFTLLFGVLLVL